MVFQRPVLLRRSVRGNLDHALARGAGAAGGAPASGGAALARFGLAALAGRAARRLSGGEQQRLAMARAWALRPEVLFMDEPCASLDPGGGAGDRGMIRAFGAEGMTVVMTTHDLAQARRLAEDVVFLHRGRLIESGAAAEFFAAPRSAEARAFLGGGAACGEAEPKMTRIRAMLAGLLLALAALAGGGGATQFITVASTTSTENSGLFGDILPTSRKRPGSRCAWSRRAPARRSRPAKRGDADVVFVHAARGGGRLRRRGLGGGAVRRHVQRLRPRRAVARPRRHPGAPNAVAAMAKIAASGGPLRLPRRRFAAPTGREGALGEGGVAPAGDWYRETGSGMGATLNIAAELPAYVLTDRGTWISFENKRDLEMLVEGDPGLFNPYGVILVNPAKHPHVKAEAGQASSTG